MMKSYKLKGKQVNMMKSHGKEGRVKDVWKEDGSHATNFLLDTIQN